MAYLLAQNIIIPKARTKLSPMKSSLSEQAIQEEWAQIQAAQKKPAAFAPLYERYYEAIFRFIYQRTLDQVRCSDLVADTFVRALEKINSYRFQGLPFSAWLYRIASNEVAQYYRKTQRKRVVVMEDQDLLELVQALKEQQDTQQEKQLWEANWDLVEKLLQSLKLEEIQLIEMRFFEKRSFKEIAAIFDWTESNAKVKLYRLLDKLREKFNQAGGQKAI